MITDDHNDNLQKDDSAEPTDIDIKKSALDVDDTTGSSGHTIETVTEVEDSAEDEAQFAGPSSSPGVIGEEDATSGSATDSEPVDIDQALEDVGLKRDSENEDPQPL